MDNFSVLVAALLERGVAIELRLTPSAHTAPIASTQPTQPTATTSSQPTQSTASSQSRQQPDLDALLYPEGIDG
jgi:hypothetical protein